MKALKDYMNNNALFVCVLGAIVILTIMALTSPQGRKTQSLIQNSGCPQ